MNWNSLTFVIVVSLVAWRLLWLAAGVQDTTAIADRIRAQIENQLGLPSDVHGGGPEGDGHPERWRVSMRDMDSALTQSSSSFELDRIAVDQWDAELPIWITPGRDRQPGWAGWDDNGNGIVDEPAELGAAWSDDDCVVAMPGEQLLSGRVIDHGAFRPITASVLKAGQRVRFDAVYMRDAP